MTDELNSNNAPCPQYPPSDELLRHWSLSVDEYKFICELTLKPKHRVWVALQMCLLKKSGHFARVVTEFPPGSLSWMNRQFALNPFDEIDFPERQATWYNQKQAVLEYLGWSYFKPDAPHVVEYVKNLVLNGHSKSDVFQKLNRFLYENKIIRGALNEFERHVSHLIEEASFELERDITERLGDQTCQILQSIINGIDTKYENLIEDLKKGFPYPSRKHFYRLVQLEALLKPISRSCQHALKIVSLDLITEYADSAKRWTLWDMKRFSPQKSNMVLSCFLVDSHGKLLDCLVQMFDRLVQAMESRSQKKWDNWFLQNQKNQREKKIIIIKAAEIFANYSSEELVNKHKSFDLNALKEALKDRRIHPEGQDSEKVDIYSKSSKLFRFILCRFLELEPSVSPGFESLKRALQIASQDKNNSIVPSNEPHFINKKYHSFAKTANGDWRKSIWEWFLILEIRARLRSQDIYFADAYRSKGFWQSIGLKSDQSNQKTSHIAQQALAKLQAEFELENRLFLDSLPNNRFVSYENGLLKLSRDSSLKEDISEQTKARIQDALGRKRIEDLVSEVDRECDFSSAFLHHATNEPLHNSKRHAIHAVLIAHATNLGLSGMAGAAEGVTASLLEKTAVNYISQYNLREANARVVNYQAQLEMSDQWGTGNISSSDGQLFGVKGKSLVVEYHPRRFGWLKRGINVYTHLSDKYTVFSSQVLSCSTREWVAVLDGLLENDTKIQPHTHTTDTHGYTDHMFGLSWLLGYTFAPRIRDAGATRLWKLEGSQSSLLDNIFENKTISLIRLQDNWELIQGVLAALKQKLIDGRTLCMRLSNSPNDPLSGAILDLGRIVKTIIVLRWMRDEDFRRSLHAQLNKGEARHELARNVNFASGAGFRTAAPIELMNRTSALALICNIIVAWNTKNLGQLFRSTDNDSHWKDIRLSSISPLLYGHIIRTGTYTFQQEGEK